jgi:1-acyl-sn-glycerol-3-phosphate acyltransferase
MARPGRSRYHPGVLAAFSVLYWAFFALTLPVFFVGALVVFAVTAPFDRRRVALHLYSCFWGSFYVYLNPLWRCRVTGRERLPWRGAAVIVANHLALVDIVVLYGLYRPFKWVSKSSLFKVPFLGWNMALNDYVPVTRGAADSVRRMLAHCRRHLAAGSPLLLFPEGTRSATGELQPFKDGAFRLAREAGVPVIPVALSGTYESIPKHGVVMRSRMDARVEILEPIDSGAFPDAAALRDAARSAIAGALARRAGGDRSRPAA